jgi:hypothetical protein
VTVIQRLGSGLQLNVHGHALVLDGVFTDAVDGTLRFHSAPPPTDYLAAHATQNDDRAGTARAGAVPGGKACAAVAAHCPNVGTSVPVASSRATMKSRDPGAAGSRLPTGKTLLAA